MNLAEVRIVAPPTPACFPDRDAWTRYLADCQEQGRGIATRPFDANRAYRPAFSFCRDCTAEHASQMALAGRCDPARFHLRSAARECATT